MLYSILNSNYTRRVMAPKRKGRPPRNESRVRARFRQSVYNLWKENKEDLGFGNRTNGEFGEIVIHRISTLITPQSASNASKRRRIQRNRRQSLTSSSSKFFCFFIPDLVSKVFFTVGKSLKMILSFCYIFRAGHYG